MPRPSTSTQERLIDAGRQLLAEQGFSGLGLRAVAARAKVNLGMFNYHFKGKEDFVRQVAQGVYEDFFKDLSLDVEGEKDPLRALRKGLLALARFTREQRLLLKAIVKDLLLGNAEARRFALANGPRHGKLILGLVERCQKEGKLARHPRAMVMTLLMSGIGAPNLMADAVIAAAPKLPFGLTKKIVEQSLLSDKALELRVDLLLKALKP